MSDQPVDQKPHEGNAITSGQEFKNDPSRPSTANRSNAFPASAPSRRNSAASVAQSPTAPRFGTGRPFELPPLPQPCAAPRSVGITSLFNNPQDDEKKPNRRRKASELDSPTSPGPSLPPLASATGDIQPRSLLQRDQLSYSGPSDNQPRHILTPRSPSASLRQVGSLNRLAQSTGTASLQNSPYAPSPSTRALMNEPAAAPASAPSLPTPSSGYQAAYAYPAPNQPQQRRASVGTTRTGKPPSPSASPSTSYSSYSQTPPPAHNQFSLSQTSSGYPRSIDSRQYESGGYPGQERLRPASIPITSSAGPNSYQLMTYETSSGAIQLPVDMHAASRAADEKRRRNAGASARFRQRRKEKEKEASTTISKLEHQVKDLSGEVEYYRRERNYLAGVVRQVPGGERHFPRPPSPASSRNSGAVVAGPSGQRGSRAQRQNSARHSGGRSPEDDRTIHASGRQAAPAMTLPPPPPPAQGVPAAHGSETSATAASHPAHPYMTQHYAAQAPPPQVLHREQQPIYQPHGSYAQPVGGRQPVQAGQIPVPPPSLQHQSQQQHAPPAVQGYGEPKPMQPPPAPQHLMQAPPQTGPWNPFAVDKRPSGPPPPGPSWER